MTATIEVACPTCKTTLALPHAGHFSCPKCGQRIEVGNAPDLPSWSTPPPRAKKLKVTNGLGWWTAVTVIGWLLVLPGIGLLLFSALSIVTAFSEPAGKPDAQTAGLVIAFGFGAPGLVMSLVAFGLFNWAESGRSTLVCGNCRNQTTKHAKLCPSCRADF